MTSTRYMITIDSVEGIYTQLMEHLSDRFCDPKEAINKATYVLAKYYISIDEEDVLTHV